MDAGDSATARLALLLDRGRPNRDRDRGHEVTQMLLDFPTFSCRVRSKVRTQLLECDLGCRQWRPKKRASLLFISFLTNLCQESP